MLGLLYLLAPLPLRAREYDGALYPYSLSLLELPPLKVPILTPDYRYPENP